MLSASSSGSEHDWGLTEGIEAEDLDRVYRLRQEEEEKREERIVYGGSEAARVTEAEKVTKKNTLEFTAIRCA